MRRREFVTLLGGAAVVGPFGAAAQQPVPLVGFIRSSSVDDVAALVAAFRQGLAETGHVDGRTVAIEIRSADDRYDKLPAIVADLIGRRASVLVGNAASARAAKAATATVPIVFAAGGDPVRDGLVASFNQPGGNVTGVSFFNSDLGAKKLELVRSLASAGAGIGVLENPDSAVSRAERADVAAAAQAVGQRVVLLGARTDREFEGAFATLARERGAALLVTGDALFLSRRDALVALAARHAVPAIYSERLIVEAGGLMSYGASIVDAYRQVGRYAGRILDGERPADLPVMRPTTFELVVNLKAATALGIALPGSLLARADTVIE